jgi:hypothetical protein
MLKKNIAIFTLLIFFLAQFGKDINFCFCKLSAFEQTNTFTCDCERQLFTAIKADNSPKNQTAQNISTQLPSEELFHLPNFSSVSFHHTVFFTSWPKASSEKLYHVFGENIFRPPLQAS